MTRPPKFVPVKDHLKMCDMQKQGSGPRIIAREFNGAYHPSHVTRLLTKCPELVASCAGREAVANVLAPAQTIGSPNLSISINPSSSLGTSMRVGWRSSDRTKPNMGKTQVRKLVSPDNSLGSLALGGDDDGDEVDDESGEIDFDSLDYGILTPIQSQISSVYPELVNPFTVFQRTAADVFNYGIMQTASQFYDNLSRRLFPNLYPDPYKTEVQELKDRLNRLNMKQTTSNLEETGASQRPQTCTGYCEVEPDGMDSSIVNKSRQLKGSGDKSNVTHDQSALPSDSEKHMFVGKKVSDIDRPILPLKIPDVTSAGSMSSPYSIATSTRTESPLAEQNMAAQEKIIDPKSFIVTQPNGHESESANRNAAPAVRSLNDAQPFTPTLLSVKDESPDLVLSGVAESQIGRQPPHVIEAAKSEFSSPAPPLSEIPVEPKATIDQAVSTPLDDTNQNSNQPPGTSQESTEAEHKEVLCETNRTEGKIDTQVMKEKNDSPWWLPLAIGGAAVLGVTYLELALKPQLSMAPTHRTPEHIGQIPAAYMRVLGPGKKPAKKPPSLLYGMQPENDKIVF